MLDDLASRHPLRLGVHLHRLRLARELKGPEAAARLYQPPPPGVDADRAAVLAKLARLEDEDVAGREAVLEAALAQEAFNPFWRLGVAHVKLTAYDLVSARAEEERELGEVMTSAESFAEALRINEEARQHAETALQQDPSFMEAHLLLGFLWVRRAGLAATRDEKDKFRQTAQYHYEQAKALDPESLAARLNLAETHLWFDAYESAGDELRIAARLAPGVPLVWSNLGLTYYYTGELGGAVDAYRRALQLEPRNARVRAALSDCLRRDDPELALEELERARADAGDDRALLAEIAFKMGAIQEHERLYKDAVLNYQRHIDLDGADAAKARSRIRHIYEHAYE